MKTSTLTRENLEELAHLFSIDATGKTNAELAEAIIIAMQVERILAA